MNEFNSKISVLDLAPILSGSTPKDSFRRTLELAQHAEKLGYHRYWLAEHHNMPGIGSSATSILIGHIASGTKKIRVGSGGIMLPNHAPLVIAEQFGTLESLYPGRIDLGLGRASGSDMRTTRALRRTLGSNGDDFPDLLRELRSYFHPEDEPIEPGVRAIPGEGMDIPIWLLGSSGFSAQLAGRLGLPFSFASHFAPDYLLQALDLYRSAFTPSRMLDKPYVMIGLNVIAADSAEEASWLATTDEQQVLNLIRGRTSEYNPPVENMDALWNEQEKTRIRKQMDFGIIGDRTTILKKLPVLFEETKADEFIVTSHIYDHQARLRSYEILANAVNELRQ